MDYTKQAIRGFSWAVILRVSTRILTVLRILILARIFVPTQFGLYGIASLALSLAELIAETGINVFLIQKRKDVNKYINTAWIVSIARGIIIALVIILSSPIIVFLFNAPSVLHMLLLISIVPLIRGFINPAIAFYQKELKFKKEFYFRFFIFFIESFIVIVIALLSREIYSLIIGMIIGSALEVVISFLAITPRPIFRYEGRFLKEVLHRGKWVTMAGIFNYLFHNADDIVVGKILGTSSLGLYQMAYKISIFPITEISDVISKVTFPLYVKISEDKARLKEMFFKTIVLVSFPSVLFGGILLIFTREIVLIILGEKWLEIVFFLKILIVFGIIRGISGSTSVLFLAVKKQEYVSVVTLVSFVTLMLVIFPLVLNFGLIGASLAALLASIIALPAMIYFTYRALYA